MIILSPVKRRSLRQALLRRRGNIDLESVVKRSNHGCKTFNNTGNSHTIGLAHKIRKENEHCNWSLAEIYGHFFLNYLTYLIIFLDPKFYSAKLVIVELQFIVFQKRCRSLRQKELYSKKIQLKKPSFIECHKKPYFSLRLIFSSCTITLNEIEKLKAKWFQFQLRTVRYGTV